MEDASRLCTQFDFLQKRNKILSDKCLLVEQLKEQHKKSIAENRQKTEKMKEDAKVLYQKFLQRNAKHKSLVLEEKHCNSLNRLLTTSVASLKEKLALTEEQIESNRVSMISELETLQKIARDESTRLPQEAKALKHEVKSLETKVAQVRKEYQDLEYENAISKKEIGQLTSSLQEATTNDSNLRIELQQLIQCRQRLSGASNVAVADCNKEYGKVLERNKILRENYDKLLLQTKHEQAEMEQLQKTVNM